MVRSSYHLQSVGFTSRIRHDIYCHLHYSSRFTTKCARCNSAVPKQLVEISTNNRDECWHSECYMINKVNSLCRSVDDCWNLFTCFSSGMSRSAPGDLLVRPRLQRAWMSPRTERKKIARLLSRLKTSKHDWNKKCTTYGCTPNSPSPGTPWLNYSSFQCPLGIWGIECYMHSGHAAAGHWWAVSGDYMFGGKVQLAHGSVI